MASEIDDVRVVLGEATPGPWEACPMDLYVFGGDGHAVADRLDDDDGKGCIARGRGHGAEVSGQRAEGELEANVRAIALLGSTWREALDVIAAAARLAEGYGLDPLGDIEDAAACEEAIDAWRAAVRAHTEER